MTKRGGQPYGGDQAEGRAERWISPGAGLRDEDWARRHRLLTCLLASCLVGLTLFGASRHRLDLSWLLTTLAILACLVAATRLRPRRLPSVCVAIGSTVVCGSFVSMSDGLTEAHFSFLIVIPILALYRDWAPFGVFLVGTVVHHAIGGSLFGGRTFDHHDAMIHPWRWALLHGLAVLLAAGFQVSAWGLIATEERRTRDYIEDNEAQLSIAFNETPVPMALFSPDGLVLSTNSAYRSWLGLPAQLPPGFRVSDLPLTALDPDGIAGVVFEEMTRGSATSTATRRYRRHDDGSQIYVEIHSNGICDRDGRLRLIFVHCLDVTRQQEHEAELRRQVREDSLTGLLSRAAFEQDLVGVLTAGTSPASVLYLDVDRFKSINDGSGHAIGDEVLRSLAARLLTIVPAGALVARLGGDEFAVALSATPAVGGGTRGLGGAQRGRLPRDPGLLLQPPGPARRARGVAEPAGARRLRHAGAHRGNGRPRRRNGQMIRNGHRQDRRRR